MTIAIVGKWGSSLGIRLPADAARALGLDVGAEVEILTENGNIVVRPLERKLKLEDLFGDESDEYWRAEYAKAYDWGPDVGREIIDE